MDEKIYAVGFDGGMTKTSPGKQVENVSCYVKQIITSHQCASYDYYEYIIVDSNGNELRYSIGDYVVKKIWTSGFAEHYTLSVTVVGLDGLEYTKSFVSDIRYNLPIDLFYPVYGPSEWDISEPFKSIFPFLNEVSMYGVEAYKVIDSVRSENIKLSHRMEYLDFVNKLSSVIASSLSEIAIAEGTTEIRDREFYNFGELRKITLPSTLQKVGYYAFFYAQNVESIVCYAIQPPKLMWACFREIKPKKLFVPKESVDLYDKAWNIFAGNKEYIVYALEEAH